ncbi:RNA polymerase sigma factor [Neolewinella agarilytica]|uniref:RNA polymerase sigma-70 factor, ECF subfamily n=1 Tax=Neolewinella agarilytica TaxID=478744 RepID=A0A1H9JR31_9BACT|nr:sigma-70 family RNA polymerase sigma factor [Neolewinella agarilytica]SEQ89213.1 RNA polymerase sigma-70 factor, ECF subfamily [Neolewinella agarilytica]
MTTTERENIYASWLQEHRGILFKVIRVYAHRQEDREDLFQEVALQLWRSVDSFRGDSSLTTWIYRVALNTAMKWKGREEARQQRVGEPTLIAETDQYENEQINWLYQQIGKLSKVDRSVILLLLEGFSYREIADIIGISESNTGVKIHRIKQQLAEAAKSTDHYAI